LNREQGILKKGRRRQKIEVRMNNEQGAGNIEGGEKRV